MSDHDSDNSQSRGETDNESRCPQYSQVDSTLDVTPQMSYRTTELDYESPTDTDQHRRCTTSRSFDVTTTNLSVDQSSIRRGVMEDNGMSGPAPKTGMLVVCRGTPPVGTGPYHKGGELLEPPNLTTPQRYNAWSPSGGRIELEGRESLHMYDVWIYLPYIAPPSQALTNFLLGFCGWEPHSLLPPFLTYSTRLSITLSYPNSGRRL